MVASDTIGRTIYHGISERQSIAHCDFQKFCILSIDLSMCIFCGIMIRVLKGCECTKLSLSNLGKQNMYRDKKLFNRFSLPISPIGIVSINVRSNSFFIHQFMKLSISLSLIFFNATQLILTFRFAFFAASIPDNTSSNLPILVICLNFQSLDDQRNDFLF